ncbi:hemerythrin domain-containing protein [Petrimonas mucosa]|uniref:Hemerythrin-like domain-containing protein n=2 Tax=Dysgonomonadaceae TaxID=2005520 RepID=A0A1G4G5L2_9BACT|nr:hemerythrin domain-containing protein [Petrimonas mucosa]SCM56602.1 putative protein {ECO:0000313/EMBL:CEA15146,1} [Petrimonas mucosa]SFU57396.1 regulator of cell morphogenesis and NO signaling [Porphyromonadaceae bacterium KHP3R9]
MYPKQGYMYHVCRTYVKPGMKLFDLIEENPALLLVMQHFDIDFRVGDLTVSQLCQEKGISERLFISIANLYNGFKPKENPIDSIDDVEQIVRFLKNSHNYYRNDKYPQISAYIKQLQENHPEKELKLLEQFFNEYFAEVIDHLDYEDNIAFPYFIEFSVKRDNPQNTSYSALEYSEHHSDIELKIRDIKNLLLKYVTIEDDLGLRRKLLFALYELEYDLYVHSLIEETILIPFGYNMEKA